MSLPGLAKPIVIMGANASGKTVLSLKLSKKIGAEIISADSRQIYEHLSAGTSKPNGRWEKLEEEKLYNVEGVFYHLVDFLNPSHTYDVARYIKDFSSGLNGIEKRKKKTIIAGGTGMYINAIFNGIDELPKSDPALRTQLYNFANENGREALHKKLQDLDPKSAKNIHPNNIQRIIRAIEISTLCSAPASAMVKGEFMKDISLFDGFFIMLKWEKQVLKERIKKRTVLEFDNWMKETKNLINAGYAYDCPGLKSLGYPQIISHLEGEINKQETIETIVVKSLEYAKRQNTWFSRYKNVLLLEFSSEKDFDADKISDLLADKINT